METLVGNQRLTGVGNILPTGSPIRVYYVSAHSTVSASSLTLHNGLYSSTTATIYLVMATDSAGNIHESWSDGVYFPDGVWLDTFAAGTVTTIVGYSKVTA
jgi:hypothetical protein